MPLDIMPATRTWDKETEEFAERLLLAAPDYDRAALALLFRSSKFTAETFSRYLTDDTRIDWHHLVEDLEDSYLTGSASDLALLHIAFLLADDLWVWLSRLDTDGARDVVDVIRFAVGR